jgi:5-methylcytosine-specific restriction enzyme A
MPYQPPKRKLPWVPDRPAKHQGRRERSKEYSTSKWQKFRLDYLSRFPLCELCQKLDNRVETATVLDHIQQVIKGGAFYSEDNVRGLCYTHHQRVSALQAHGKTL